MKIPHFLQSLGLLLTFALLSISCSQDSDLITQIVLEEIEQEVAPVVEENKTTNENSTPVIDYQKGTITLLEDKTSLIDITKGAAATTTGKSYALKSITQPINGKTAINELNQLVYTPDADFNGTDAFTYTLNIQAADSSVTEQVNSFKVTITPAKDVVDDVVTTNYETATTISPLANDTFSKSTNVAISEISLATKGTATLNKTNNTISYTPNKNTSGVDQILYKTTITTKNDSILTENGSIKITVLSNEFPKAANIKYVTTTGKSTNDGATEATAWSITHAFNTAKVGDIVYIKAGNYGAVNLTVKNSGNSVKPIQFIGYKAFPGDINSVDGSTVSYEDYKRNGNKLDANVMPLLEGKRTNNIGTGRAIQNYGKSYIKIENFQIRYYEYGILSEADNCYFNNIISTDHGDFDPNHSYPSKTNNSLLNLKGNGIWIAKSNNNSIINCLAINNGARGIVNTQSNNTIHKNNKVYSDNTTNPTDYYYLIYSSDYNILENIYVERVGKLEHLGHGINLKVDSSFNTLKNCTSKNTPIQVSLRGHDNTFDSCKVIGGIDKNGSFLIANNSYNNTFLNCSAENVQKGVAFGDWKESDGNNVYDNAGHDNKFIGFEVSNSEVAIDFYFYDQGNTSAYDNIFENCLFKNLNSLFRVDRPNKRTTLKNTTIENVKKLRESRYINNEKLSLDLILVNNKSINNAFSF